MIRDALDCPEGKRHADLSDGIAVEHLERRMKRADWMRARWVVEAWKPSVHRYSSSNQRSAEFNDWVGQTVAHTLPSIGGVLL